MNTVWEEYAALLEEVAGLEAAEARGIAEADATYASEARRLRNDLVLAEREFTALKSRNTRLQVSVRDLVRKLRVAAPASSGLPPLAPSQLGDALKSAEYDLDQIRRSVEYLRAQRQIPAPPAPAPVAPSSPMAMTAGQGDAQQIKSFPEVPVLVGAGGALAALLALALVLM